MMRKFETDPFHASWRFIRYDDYEIFEAGDEYWEQTAKEIAAAGFTHVMTFSNTHFRWSYYLEWPRLTEVLRRLVVACHRHGLYVVEHHSANLISIASAVGNESMNIGGRTLNPKNWPTLKRDLNPENIYKNVCISSMFQVDGTTGKPQETFYNSHIMCHNNPDYLRLYTGYLAELYETGIDGIMTDDVQFLADGFAACSCVWCREKFKNEYGLELPADGVEWREFIADEASDLFLKWKKFRYESTVNFHHIVKNHYESSGYQMMRPNFAATCVSWRSPWAGTFDELPTLDWAFIEHCCGVIRYSWPEFLIESIHCSMMARQRGIPAMSLYYPGRTDIQRLAWAISLYVGHRYFGDPKNESLFEDQVKFHVFETAHFESLFKMKLNARVAILDSVLSRELDPEYNIVSRNVICSLGQAMSRFNLPWSMTDCANYEEYKDFDAIIVPSAFLADKEISNLAEYGRKGGVLIWVDGAGSWNLTNVSKRGETELHSLLAGANVIYSTAEKLSTRFIKRCRVSDTDPNDRNAFDCAEPTLWQPLSSDELVKNRESVEFIASLISEKGRGIKLSKEHCDLLYSCYYSEDRPLMSLRICNACGTMERPEEPGFGEKDAIPFPKFESMVNVELTKPKKWENHIFSNGKAFTEQLGDEFIVITVRDEGKSIFIDCPLYYIHEFMLIELS